MIFTRKFGAKLIMAGLLLASNKILAEQPLPASICGEDPAKWGFFDMKNKATAPSIVKQDGMELLSFDNQGGKINCKSALGENDVITVRFRIAPYSPTQDKSPRSYLNLLSSLKDYSKTKTSCFSTQIKYNYSNDSLAWIVNPFISSQPDKASKKLTCNGVYNPNSINLDKSLGWPEHLRRLIESEVSFSRNADRWMTFRFEVLAKNHVQIFLNGFLMADICNEDLDATGLFSVECLNLLISELKIEKRSDENPKHLMVDISGALNANSVNGKKTAIDAENQKVTLKGIPFSIPFPTANGNNHVDIGRSWFPEGQMLGSVTGAHGGTGGRWPVPMLSPPYRIQFKIPKARYQAIHLLALSDGGANKVSSVTAQFYRPLVGFPESFTSPTVPGYATVPEKDRSVSVKFEDHSIGNLHLITIPINPGALLGFDDLDSLCIELTKEVQLFRSYPDPMFYSQHAAGLPSGVHVFAMTLEKPDVELTLKPSTYGDLWISPEKVQYSLTLKNTTAKQKELSISWDLSSYDRTDSGSGKLQLKLSPNEVKVVSLEPHPKLYGYYDFRLSMKSAEESWTETRGLTVLHPDTRERGDWKRGKGCLFGFWQWNGGQGTPPGYLQAEVMAKAGAETQNRSIKPDDEKLMEVARKYKMVDKRGFLDGIIYVANKLKNDLAVMPEDEAVGKYMDVMRKRKTAPDDVHQPEYSEFFSEPQLGPHTYGTLPTYFDEPELDSLGEDLEKKYQSFLKAFLAGGKAIKKEWPGMKTYMPWGDPSFPILFLRRSPEFREMFDGVAVDIPGFEHLPEKQIHQVSLHRMFFLKNELMKANKSDIDLVMVEGVCLPTRPGSLSEREQADQTVRSFLVLMGYGIDHFSAGISGFECSSVWGEQHYGGGLYNRLPIETPKPSYAAFATMTRNLNRCNFTRWLPTGSLSAYCLEFTHSKTGEKVYAIWTLKGKRGITLSFPENDKITVVDQMDNPVKLDATSKGTAFSVTSAPCFVRGLSGISAIQLGEPDHSDSVPSEFRNKLGNLGDGKWKISAQPDMEYENSFKEWVKRFPAGMTAEPATAPESQGGKSLRIHLTVPEKDRNYMPFYSTLLPESPVLIPGKAASLGLWVKASSDWGRVIYCLRDAKGELWMSIGTRNAWNCDDILCMSYFNFDGWRYLSFPLPGNAPYDAYRENGTTWWGAYSKGDGIVDLPLSLEKIIVERRTHAMYVNSPQPASPDDVCVADLYAEYTCRANMQEHAVELSRLRMPVPKNYPALKNPIGEITKTAILPPLEISGIRIDDQVADGTRCYVDFKPAENAKTYDVWASCYPDGRGAAKLGKEWNEPGKMIRGLSPDTDFYLFVVYCDAEKKTSKPSQPFKVHLKDMFGMK